MLFKTKYGEAVQKILYRYGATDASVVALEILLQTAQADVKQRDSEELAKQTCRGLHMDKPGRGVVCAKCFDAAFAGRTEQAVPGDVRAQGRTEPPAGMVPAGGELAAPRGAAKLPEPPQKEIDRDAIEADVKRMLAEPRGRG